LRSFLEQRREREVKKVNRRILGILAGLIVVSILATPVLAIGGPQKAENNPNTETMPYGVALNLPSGVSHEWVNGIDKFICIKDARDFKINNAFELTSISQVAGMENKWLFFSPEMWAQWIASIFQIPVAAARLWVANHNPEGVYYKENFLG
jgi:hypothetical protein